MWSQDQDWSWLAYHNTTNKYILINNVWSDFPLPTLTNTSFGKSYSWRVIQQGIRSGIWELRPIVMLAAKWVCQAITHSNFEILALNLTFVSFVLFFFCLLFFLFFFCLLLHFTTRFWKLPDQQFVGFIWILECQIYDVSSTHLHIGWGRPGVRQCVTMRCHTSSYLMSYQDEKVQHCYLMFSGKICTDQEED